MKQREYFEQTAELMERVKKGAFLTVRADNMVNTITIGCATIGYTRFGGGSILLDFGE